MCAALHFIQNCAEKQLKLDAYVDDGGDVSALFEGAEIEHPGPSASACGAEALRPRG